MDINWTQVVAQMFGTALIVPVSTAVGFLVMRYFPKFWESTIEKPIIKFVKMVKTNGNKGGSHVKLIPNNACVVNGWTGINLIRGESNMGSVNVYRFFDHTVFPYRRGQGRLTKAKANKIAVAARRKGVAARVVKEADGYVVFTRNKRG